MKDWKTLETSAQNEALINEFKGNLFEYQMAFLIAKSQGREVLSQFVNQFQGNFKLKLSQYETWMRNNDPDCLSQLPILAKESFKYLKDQIPSLGKNIDEVLLIGKLVAGQDDFKESDILIKTKQGPVPMSLKLCKEQAFVNTKSGGVLSFIEKYFQSYFPQFRVEQQLLNDVLKSSFLEMGTELYENHELGSFEGQFDQRWTEEFSELPGELNAEDSAVLGRHYHRVISKIYAILQSFYHQDSQAFLQCLSPIVGMGRNDMIQLTCFHKHSKQSPYEISSVELFTPQDWERQSKECRIGKIKDGMASFEIIFQEMLLQIRVKPMNKFTAMALKINCSVKRRSNE